MKYAPSPEINVVESHKVRKPMITSLVAPKTVMIEIEMKLKPFTELNDSFVLFSVHERRYRFLQKSFRRAYAQVQHRNEVARHKTSQVDMNQCILS